VVFAAAGCSSDSGSGSAAAKSGASHAASAGMSKSASPAVRPAKYGKLPKACAVLPSKTLGELVPKASKSGKAGASDEASSRVSCSWSSLDNNGVKGSEFRWLNVSLLRFDSDANRGSGDAQAQAYYAKQVRDAQAVSGAKNTKLTPVAGAGDAATAVRYDLKKKEGSFKQQTVVARVANVVVTVDYNGAGLAGETTPDATALTKDAEQAAKAAVASVASANPAPSGGGSGKAKPTPSKSASKATSKSASASPSKSASAKR
jgi:hypothetical protein